MSKKFTFMALFLLFIFIASLTIFAMMRGIRGNGKGMMVDHVMMLM